MKKKIIDHLERLKQADPTKAKEIIVASIRVVDMRVPAKHSMKKECSECGFEVWISQAMQASILDKHKGIIMCIRCMREKDIYPGKDDWEEATTQAIIEEVKDNL